jgi:broad specificity polyphosphatase/5'/3'-nucleotidase SurE
MTCTRVLLTNDDGVDAQGLRAVRAVLVECFDSVVTVAPTDCVRAGLLGVWRPGPTWW